MFDFLKRKRADETETPEHTAEKIGFFGRLKQGLSKTRNNISTGLARVFLGKKELNAELLTEIENDKSIVNI